MRIENDFLRDVIEWDIGSWSPALDYWKEDGLLGGPGLRCLEIGGRSGGLSLWLASMGHHVICSDFELPDDKARTLHASHKVVGKIEYAALDAMKLDLDEEFDIVIFKSVMGSATRNMGMKGKKEFFEGIHRALKPGGTLLFAENLESSALHRFFRRRFTTWGQYWNYLCYDEIADMLAPFINIQLKTVGFFAAFGRSEDQRAVLAKLDKACRFLIPKSMRYIAIVKAKKPENPGHKI